MLYLLAISQEDSDKLAFIFRKYEKPLFYFIFTIIKDWHLAEDILQLTFVKIILNIGGVAEADSAKTRKYVYTIARNSAVDYYRAKQKYDDITVEYDDNMTIEDVSIQEKETIANASLDDLEMAIAVLSDSDREIIALKYKMGFSDPQISEMLGIRNDAVRKRLSRAKKRLAAIIISGRAGEES